MGNDKTLEVAIDWNRRAGVGINPGAITSADFPKTSVLIHQALDGGR
jgi:NADPH-dependent 7-cyano-7-deazaguanine reductase QueF